MGQSDFTTITNITALIAAALAVATGAGYAPTPLVLGIAGAIPLVALAVIAGVRAYVAIKGAEQTNADETLAEVEGKLAELAKLLGAQKVRSAIAPKKGGK